MFVKVCSCEHIKKRSGISPAPFRELAFQITYPIHNFSSFFPNSRCRRKCGYTHRYQHNGTQKAHIKELAPFNMKAGLFGSLWCDFLFQINTSLFEFLDFEQQKNTIGQNGVYVANVALDIVLSILIIPHPLLRCNSKTVTIQCDSLPISCDVIFLEKTAPKLPSCPWKCIPTGPTKEHQ